MRYFTSIFLFILSINLIFSQDCDPRIVITRGEFHAGWNEYFTIENNDLINLPLADISVYQITFTYDYESDKSEVIKTYLEIDEIKGRYKFSSAKIRQVNIDFRYKDSLYQYEFKVHPMPVKARLSKHGARSKKKMTVGEFKAQPGLLAIIYGMDIQARCLVKSFEIHRISEKGEAEFVTNLGGRYAEDSRKLISRTQGGDLFLFRKIYIKCPGDEDQSQLEDMTFEIAHAKFQIDTIDYTGGYKAIRRIDNETHDTTITDEFSGVHTVTTKENIKLVQGFYNIGPINCGEGYLKNGLWIERYRNGTNKSIGSYLCDSKIGTWTYFYENGNISKIETYDHAYPGTDDWRTILKSGPETAYYKNGSIKSSGYYDILEIYQNLDTFTSINYDTYEEKLEIVEGDFWKPISMKVGYWRTFDKGGQLIAINPQLPLHSEQEIRAIHLRKVVVE